MISEDHTPYQYHKIPLPKINITRSHSRQKIPLHTTISEDHAPYRRSHSLSISQDPISEDFTPYQYHKTPLPTINIRKFYSLSISEVHTPHRRSHSPSTSEDPISEDPTPNQHYKTPLPTINITRSCSLSISEDPTPSTRSHSLRPRSFLETGFRPLCPPFV